MDSYRAIAQEAIDALGGEEAVTESQFGVGNPAENYHEVSEGLQARLEALDAESQGKPS